MIYDSLRSILSAQLSTLLTRSGCGFPVSIPHLCKTLGVEYHLETMPLKVDGLYFLTEPDGAPHIIVNSHRLKPPGRQRFTGAHEISHHLVARHLGLKTALFLDRSGEKTNPIERLCNQSAAELLMPRETVTKAWHDLRAYRKNEAVCAMCVLFGVTGSAMRVRLEELELMPKFGAGGHYR